MFDPTLLTFSDYVLVATDPHIVIAGSRGAWAPRVRGYDPEDGAEVGIAFYYRDDYETKGEASRIAREMLACVRSYRQRQHGIDAP